MRQFIDEHFNVLLLALLFLVVMAVFFHAMHHPSDASNINWLEHDNDQILAALLGMMTGYRIGMAAATAKKEEPPEPPKPSEEPPKQ